MKIDWTSVLIVSIVVGIPAFALFGVVVEVLKLIALVKWLMT
jgi:hypothetical protein